MSNPDRPMTSNGKIPPPPPGARRWVRYLLGLTVGVAVGLAPWLGRVEVPGFEPLLSLFPQSLQNTAIPLAAFAMGTVAVVVQYYSEARVRTAVLDRAFPGVAISLMLGLLAFTSLYVLSVRVVEFSGGDAQAAFVVGLGPRPASCTACPPELSDSDCILRGTTFDPAAIESCWGTYRIQVAELALTLAYLVLMGSFAGLVGILVLRNRQPRSERE